MSSPPEETSRAAGTRSALRAVASYFGLFVLLFVARYLLRDHLVPRVDQECHIGGIATELLAHGLRFPLLAYAPNEYDNGSLFSGALAALVFAISGPSYLGLKLVTHAFATAGALAACSLLRRCLHELGCRDTGSRVAAFGVLVFGLAFAPRIVTAAATLAVGNHAEGAAMVICLLAVFASGIPRRATPGAFLFWVVTGLCLYLNKGTFLALAAMLAACVALDTSVLHPTAVEPADEGSPGTLGTRWTVIVTGLLLGLLPEIIVIATRHGRGWAVMSSKLERNAPRFPRGLLNGLDWLTDQRPTTMCAFFFVLALFAVVAVRSRQPTIALVTATSWLHLVGLAVMGQGGFDRYSVYGHFPFLVLLATALACLPLYVGTRLPPAGRSAVLLVGVLGCAFVTKPDAIRPSLAKARALGADAEGAVCSWRFAEGFGREVDQQRTPPGTVRGRHQLTRCRSLDTDAQRLDCVGGIARELTWRMGGEISTGAPPPELTAEEAEAYAFNYGLHRRGDDDACLDFTDNQLAARCRDAVALDCLGFADVFSGISTAENLGRPRCHLPEPPLPGYWRSTHRDLFARTAGRTTIAFSTDIEELVHCRAILDSCYP